MNGNRIPPCRPHGLHTLDPGRHASSGAPGAPWRFAGVLRSSRARNRPGGRSQRPVVAAFVAALAFLLLAAPAAAQSVPGAPTGLMVTVGHKAVKVDWTAPADDGGSAVTEYEVHVGEIRGTGSTNTSYVTETGNFSSITIIRVRAVNANGKGPWSANAATETGPATVTIAGPMEVAEDTPALVPFTLTTDRPVLLTSEPLDVSVVVSETHNMIWAQEKGTKTVSFALGAQTATLTARIENDNTHESDSDVTAAIQTSSDYTVGTPSSATVTVTDNDHVPGPPTGLTATLTHFDFDVSWTAPANTGSGPILGYRIDAPEADPRVYYVDTTAAEIIGRAKSPRDYTVRVRAFNAIGDGDWSDPIVVSVRRATITITGNDPVIEGSDAVFTLTTDLVNRYKVNGQSVLIANILVSESDDMVASTNEKEHMVRFATDATTATLTVPTEGDDRDERDSVVTATIQAKIQPIAETALVETYETGSPASATVTVANDDVGNFERRGLDSCGVSAPHSSGHAIECFQLVNSSYVRTPEGMAARGYAPSRNNPLEVGDIVAMEGLPDDWVISVLGEKVAANVVTIAAGTSSVTEGTNVMFTVTRATAATTHLSVTVDVEETQSMIFNGCRTASTASGGRPGWTFSRTPPTRRSWW